MAIEETEVLPDEFKDAFNETAGASAEPTDDDAFGITPPPEAIAAAEAIEGQAEGDTAVNTDAAADVGSEAVQTDEKVAADATAAEAVKTADEDDEEAGMTQKEIQRKRSWEGRLKKMEADLKAVAEQNKGQTATQALADVVADAAPDASETQAQSAEEVSEQLQDGTLTPEQAMKQLAEDFGEDFVKMISTLVSKQASEIAGKTVADSVQKVSDEVKEITSHIKDADERRHFEAVAGAVPDFFEQIETSAFKDFLKGADEKIQRVAANGSAKEVIAMMAQFKASAKPAATQAKAAVPAVADEEDPALAAAEGVRSGAMRLPAEPGNKDDFEGAWAEAERQA